MVVYIVSVWTIILACTIQGSIVNLHPLSDALRPQQELKIMLSISSSGEVQPASIRKLYHKIVYVSVGSALASDTYQVYPLFMQLLSAQYPGLCKSINLDERWKAKEAELSNFRKLLIQRDPTLTPENFFLINEKLEKPQVEQLLPYLTEVLQQGGIVILGKFTNYTKAITLPLLYMKLKSVPATRKDALLLFSTIPSSGLTVYWWQGKDYLYYDDMIMTERLKKNIGAPINQEQYLKDFLQKWQQGLDSEQIWEVKNLLRYFDRSPAEFVEDFTTRRISFAAGGPESTETFVIDVTKDNKDVFSISNVYFLKQLFQDLNNSLSLIKLLAAY